MRKQTGGEGYLLVDHSASPGLPPWAARRSGFDPAHTKEGKRYETATFTCKHCRVVVVKSPFRTKERPRCMKCGGHYICDSCDFLSTLPDYNHTPYEKKVDLILDASARGVPAHQIILP